MSKSIKVNDKRGKKKNGVAIKRRLELFIDAELSGLLDQLAWYHGYDSTLEYLRVVLAQHALGEQALIQAGLVQVALNYWRDETVPA